jgi:hypothetical protein
MRLRLAIGIAAAASVLFAGAKAGAQTFSREAQERLSKLEKRVADLEAEEVKDKRELAKKDRDKKAIEANFAKGVISIKGLRLRFGGSVKVNLVEDPQDERSPVFGNTESPDPHAVLQRFRLATRVDFLDRRKTVGQVFLSSQVDVRPTAGDAILKRATLNYRIKPEWWFASETKAGLADRFIRVSRLTQSYPLIGTAIWRQQETGIWEELRLGAKRGRPEAAGAPGKKAKSGKKSGKAAAREEEGDGEQPASEAAGSDSGGRSDADSDSEFVTPGTEGEAIPAIDTMSRSTTHRPFDVVGNPGVLKLHFSLADGFGYDTKKIGRDGAAFNEVLRDSRDFSPPLSMREVGVGVGYARDFRELGEFEVLGFFFEDELNEHDTLFLQTNLTERDVTLAPIRGYGDSGLRYEDRKGLNAGYHLEAYQLYRPLRMVDSLHPKRGDGLYLFYQYIDATDGALDRTGWYLQASYRLSNPAGWKVLRSVEPVVRYGELMPDIAKIPSLPLTWTRRQWLVGVVVGLVRGVYLRTEYTFNDEASGAGSVANNELLVQLLATF